MKITLNENLKRMRTERGMTQGELAAALSVTPQSVSRWENGQAYPDTEMLPVRASYFGVTLDELMMGENMDTGRLLDEQRAIERAMRKQPTALLQMQLCDVLEKIVERKPDNVYYLGLYFRNLIKRKNGYGGVSEKQVERVRNIFRERLKRAEIEERYLLLDEVIKGEEEEKLILWKSYVPNSCRSQEFLWDDLLMGRYHFRGDVEHWETQNQLALYRQIGRALRHLTINRPEVSVDNCAVYPTLPLRDVAHYEMAMTLLNTFSTRVDDIFLAARVAIEFDYAGALFAAGDKERGFEMLDLVKAHAKLMWDKACKRTVMRGSVPFLSQVKETYDAHFVMGVNPFSLMGNVLGYHKRSEFDSVRNDDRFRTYVSEMHYLTPMTHYVGRDADTLANLPDFKGTFDPMLTLAREQLRTSGGTLSTQVTVLYTKEGNTYHAVEPNAMEGQPCTLRLLKSLRDKGDSHIERCVIVWWRMGGEVDVPSYEVREKMLELDPKNRETKILICSGEGFAGCPLFKTGNFS